MASLFFPKDSNQAKVYSKAVADGKLKRLRRGIYTDASWEQVPQVVQQQWHAIAQYLQPNGIASHVTAVELRPVNQVVYITAKVKVRKKIRIADALSIEIIPGNVELLTEQFVPHLKRSAPARYLMENLSIAQQKAALPKALGKSWVEEELCRIQERYGEGELNVIRDQARTAAEALSMQREFNILNKLIGAILTTQPTANLATAKALASARKEPYDKHRLERFIALKDYLLTCQFSPSSYEFMTSSWRHLAFYESYFSNYIEGTEFEIDEAEHIVFEKAIIGSRHEDSHDVLAVYDVVHDYSEMSVIPGSADELMDLLINRHQLIMHQRKDKRPGVLKAQTNKAGDTTFVQPALLEGTLSQGFHLYQAIPEGLPRAIFMQFLVTECHPFDDGNGRLARIMMNAELVAVEQHKLIVPTVHRESYLNGLRQATRSGKFRTMAKVFADLQAYTAAIPWHDYAEARATLEAHQAHKQPDQGVPAFNRQLAQFKHRLPAG
ncbi:cell filamentation protein Fic [Aliidiomarina minuta]|uniref:Cell filamentation protein Fic n=1 Tax=Aliidiomarina minuta TaxID=880057 RepID=A0A432W8B5_9GAMM|nr:Fic family protein [Aliidiomarina minuta]RUO26289.1 cell filamentation protein Fic [Aliidiomarina minuta]